MRCWTDQQSRWATMFGCSMLMVAVASLSALLAYAAAAGVDKGRSKVMDGGNRARKREQLRLMGNEPSYPKHLPRQRAG